MYQKILEKNKNFIQNQKMYSSLEDSIQESVSELNSKKIFFLSGLKHTGKTKLIHALLKKTRNFDSSFYYNSDLDSLGLIKTHENLITLLDIHIRIQGIPKIIILQNTNNITGIKKFIAQLYKTKKYKLIIVWNNIRIEWVREIELFPAGINKDNVEESFFGWISEVRVVSDLQYKDFLLSALKCDIVSRDILESYNIKNISLFYRIMTYIAQSTHYQSLREIHRSLAEHDIDISLLTMIDYINAALNTKLLSRAYLYDVKNCHVITSKAQYFFWDAGIRRAFDKNVDLTENLLYIELRRNLYNITAWLNGRFQFAFRAEKDGKVLSIALDNSQDKNEIRKTARKLEKIWDDSQKIVIVKDKNSLGMRKFLEEWVEIIELREILEKI